MPRLLDVSDDVRAEIGDSEATRLLAGENTPGTYDCTSCRTPGDAETERTSTVLFVGEETAVLAFAHASCIPSQVVPVAEEQLQGAVRSITAGGPEQPGPAESASDAAVAPAAGPPEPADPPAEARQAVLGVTSGLVMVDGQTQPALVVEPTDAIVRPGSTSTEDEFFTLLTEQGFTPMSDLDQAPPANPGWSVLLAMGQLHALLQPGPAGAAPVAWWQAHQPLHVTDGWRATVNASQRVFVYAAPAGSIGHQPREDLLREALDRAAANGVLVAASMPLAGT